MLLKKILFSGLLCLFLGILMVGDTGCANIIPPTGGPKDTLPPVLLAAAPRDSALQFTGKKITLNFNEYVQLENASENVIVSPLPTLNPSFDAKLRTITITIKDTLQPNTTYSINFGKAIKDINEGNVYKEFTYVFSTGTYLDDRTLSGTVTIAETGKTDSTMIAMLYQDGDDSAVVKKRPRYITRLDNRGHFTFRNLPSGTFYLYALKDESGTRRYTDPSQLFAFAGKPLTISANNEPVQLYAYVEKAEEPKKRGSGPAPIATGSREKKAEDKRLRYQTNLENGQHDILDTLRIQFATPLKTFDSTKLVFTDEKFQQISNYALVPDSLNQRFSLLYTWKLGTAYNLILGKELAEDSAGRKLVKIDTIDFKTKKQEDYGELRLRFPILDLSNHPVLQLIQSEKIVYTHVFTTKEFNVKIFRPGDYEIRILYDENGNGRWDAGEFFGKHKQPEKVLSIDKKFNVKANWGNDHTINLQPAENPPKAPVK
ncbi:MAG: Ig-like domain-containing protein [Williamsia sp.]|nr:Ig-like domain-containing protein [Williamsia sp.]